MERLWQCGEQFIDTPHGLRRIQTLSSCASACQVQEHGRGRWLAALVRLLCLEMPAGSPGCEGAAGHGISCMGLWSSAAKVKVASGVLPIGRGPRTQRPE